MENRYTVKVLKKIIYIDGSPYVNNFQGGIGHYTEALINQLSLVSNYEVRIVLFRGQKPPMNSMPKNVCIEYLPFNRRSHREAVPKGAVRQRAGRVAAPAGNAQGQDADLRGSPAQGHRAGRGRTRGKSAGTFGAFALGAAD